MSVLEIKFSPENKEQASVYFSLISVINYQLAQENNTLGINSLAINSEIKLTITPNKEEELEKIHNTCINLARAINQEIALSELCYSEYHLMILKQHLDLTALQISLISTSNSSESGSFEDPVVSDNMSKIYTNFLENIRSAKFLETSS